MGDVGVEVFDSVSVSIRPAMQRLVVLDKKYFSCVNFLKPDCHFYISVELNKKSHCLN